MLGRIRMHQKGDTLIEVLFAVTVFSLVAVGSLAIMNQGIATSQRALEITIVREEIDAQGQALRFMNNAYVASYETNQAQYPAGPAEEWATMLSNITNTPIQTPTEFSNVTTCPTPPSGSFIINAHGAKFVPAVGNVLQPAVTYAQVNYKTDINTGISSVTSAQGIWIEAVQSAVSGDQNQANTGYIDFHILACWNGPGSGPPVTIGTIVRLYEPRG
jgi:type II secretory pathway pseudopilin PulG